jgi:hypothetical protein
MKMIESVRYEVMTKELDLFCSQPGEKARRVVTDPVYEFVMPFRYIIQDNLYLTFDNNLV